MLLFQQNKQKELSEIVVTTHIINNSKVLFNTSISTYKKFIIDITNLGKFPILSDHSKEIIIKI